MKKIMALLGILAALYLIPSSYWDPSALQDEPISVSVQGAVEEDAILHLPRFSTLNDALDRVALREDADLSSLNRLRVLQDGDVIVIPQKKGGAKVSINTASREELMSVPGIGEGKADKILAYREQNGSFQSLEDLMKISGIKQKTFDKLKEYLCL